MSKKKGKEEYCKTCGRIVTDKKNKTGLCPKCAKNGRNAVVAAGVMVPVAIGVGKKYGKPILKSAKEIIKALIKR